MAFPRSGHFYYVPALYWVGNAGMNEDPTGLEQRDTQTGSWAKLLLSTQFYNWVLLGQRPETCSYVIKEDFLEEVMSKPALLIDVGINHFFRLVLYKK